MKLLLPLLIVLALGVASCGSDDDGEPAAQPPPVAGIGAGPGISIDEAIAMNSQEPLLVNGTVWADGDDIFFCDAVLESYPPQCAPATRLEVVGLELAEVDGLQRVGDIAWTEQRTQLLGVVADGKITVSENAMA
jgi:hypothetical protein